MTSLGWFFEAAACCSSSATRVSACTCILGAGRLCSARRDRPTLLTTARMLTSSSQTAAAIFNQRARPAFSSGSCGMAHGWASGALLGWRFRSGALDAAAAGMGLRSAHAAFVTRVKHTARSVIDDIPRRAGERQQRIAQRQRPEPQMRQRQRQREQRYGVRRRRKAGSRCPNAAGRAAGHRRRLRRGRRNRNPRSPAAAVALRRFRHQSRPACSGRSGRWDLALLGLREMVLANTAGSGGDWRAAGVREAPVAAQPAMSTQPASTADRHGQAMSDAGEWLHGAVPGTRSPHHRRRRAFGQQTKGTGMRPTSWRALDAQEKAGAPKGGWRGLADQAATSCRASATSTESPSWFRTSSPDSGTSPDVLCDTMIFLAINPRQVICEEAA